MPPVSHSAENQLSGFRFVYSFRSGRLLATGARLLTSALSRLNYTPILPQPRPNINPFSGQFEASFALRC